MHDFDEYQQLTVHFFTLKKKSGLQEEESEFLSKFDVTKIV